MKKNSGITLIALVVTIIVLLILAGVTINLAFNSNGLLNRAGEAKFKNNMATYKETVDLYTANYVVETLSTNTKMINSGEMLKEAILDNFIQDITVDDVTINITDILPNIKEEEKEYIVVYKGTMHYVSDPKRKDDKNYKKWCKDINIPVLNYAPPSGIDIINGSYEEVNGIYVCTPDLKNGFVRDRTRYLEVGENGSMVPGHWITQRPTSNWYSYKDSKWANIYVENAGQELYYVWIPRYCFKLNQETQRAEVEFIDVDNSYTDISGKVTTWQERIANDPSWQVPEAFTFAEKELPGYWMSKYTLGDAISPTTINFEMAIIKGEVTLKNIQLNETITNLNPVASYTAAINGNIIETFTDKSKVVTFPRAKLRKGNNTINITALNSKGEIVGSMTKEYDSPNVNEPDLSGFNKETTFYVTYDAKGNEHSTVPVTQAAPSDWYDYGASQWANIVTRNNDVETYYVWIPRYQFQLDQANQRSMVRFINGKGTKTEPGYQIPEAFTFNGQELTGYWMSKYTLGDATGPAFSTEITTTNTEIKTKGITGTGVKAGLTYNYYLNGVKKASSTNASEHYTYTGLQANKEYTIHIEVRETATDKYVGTATKRVKTNAANKPDLSGFNPDVTYYVTYDDSGNPVTGSKITTNGSNMPQNWYDYTESKWANILVDTGTTKTYYTWIPRYEYKITDAQQAQPTIGRTDVNFIQGTGTETTVGYQIPEAFTFNGQELTGYWMSKYTLGE